jgi:hypothetical protein
MRGKRAAEQDFAIARRENAAGRGAMGAVRCSGRFFGTAKPEEIRGVRAIYQRPEQRENSGDNSAVTAR